MKVRVVTQKIDNDFFEENLNNIASSNAYENIEIAKYYVVQAIVFWKSIPFYYVYEYDDDAYPKPICYRYFEVIDGGLSRYWTLVTDRLSTGELQSFLVFDEWAENLDIYERLLDGDEQAAEIFKKYRKLLATE